MSKYDFAVMSRIQRDVAGGKRKREKTYDTVAVKTETVVGKPRSIARVGFTGTQTGMTNEQAATVSKIFSELGEFELHHGDCIGADSQAHAITSACKNLVGIVVHPPIDSRKRAFCRYCISDERAPREYLIRNHDIVDETERLIATPKSTEEELRSGTWATIRYAHQQGRRVDIVLPDGSVDVR